MASGLSLSDRSGIRVFDPGVAGVRLVFTGLRGTRGVLDCGWWPRTRDVSKELSGLPSVVWGGFGLVVARVWLSAPVWDATAEQSSLGDRVVRVAWFRARDAHTIRLLSGRFWQGGICW